jgi:hypothetical protein
MIRRVMLVQLDNACHHPLQRQQKAYKETDCDGYDIYRNRMGSQPINVEVNTQPRNKLNRPERHTRSHRDEKSRRYDCGFDIRFRPL